MLTFGNFYIHGVFVLFDVSRETIGGHTRYVACLSADPRICCTAVRAEAAVAALEQRLRQGWHSPQRAA